MGERKVLNKYIPPDFDPAKIPRGKSAKGGQIKVRIMLPMTICCNTCGEFIVKGTKFNARKEDVKGEDYLGMRIFRFYFRCTRCAAAATRPPLDAATSTANMMISFINSAFVYVCVYARVCACLK